MWIAHSKELDCLPGRRCGIELFFDGDAQLLLGNPDYGFVIKYLDLGLLELFLKLVDLSGQLISLVDDAFDDRRGWLFRGLRHGTLFLLLSDSFQPLGNGLSGENLVLGHSLLNGESAQVDLFDHLAHLEFACLSV